ncbi:uncharacterized protein [Pseudorasbora parva]|uniref:uncharacterized protein n=1 Tax=Pseudorasbora parva TaxID=51549 RepID=UPI00351E7713
MAPPRRRRRRDSMEQPPNMLSDVIHLKEEFNEFQKDIYPEFNRHSKTITALFDEFGNVYRLAMYALRGAKIAGAIGIVFSVLSFVLNDDELSFMVATAALVVSSVAAICAGLGRYKKRQLENIKQTIEEEVKGFQDKSSHIIDMMENICQRMEKILRDPWLSDHKSQALSDHFAYCFEKRPLFQEHDGSKVEDQMKSKIAHLSGNLSEMIAKVSSVPDILQEILEDNKRQKDKPAKPTHEQITNLEFKEQKVKFINDTQNGIRKMKSAMKELKQTPLKI